MKSAANVMHVDFGGSSGSDIQLIDLLAIAISLQPGVDALNLAMIIRTLSESPAINGQTRISACRMSDMIERVHAAAAAG